MFIIPHFTRDIKVPHVIIQLCCTVLMLITWLAYESSYVIICLLTYDYYRRKKTCFSCDNHTDSYDNHICYTCVTLIWLCVVTYLFQFSLLITTTWLYERGFMKVCHIIRFEFRFKRVQLPVWWFSL